MIKRYPLETAARAIAPDNTSATTAPDMEAINQREAAFIQIVSEVHRQTVRTPANQMVETLRDALSTPLVAYITGQSDRTIQRWAKGSTEEIKQDSKRRLVTAYEILQLINRFEAPGVSQTWFIGNEPQLDFITPAKAIRQDQLEEALAAARSFVAVG